MVATFGQYSVTPSVYYGLMWADIYAGRLWWYKHRFDPYTQSADDAKEAVKVWLSKAWPKLPPELWTKDEWLPAAEGDA